MKIFLQLLPVLAVGSAFSNMFPDYANQTFSAPIKMARETATRYELHQLSRMVAAHYEVDERLPTAAEFPTFVRERFKSDRKDPCDDFFTRPYLYQPIDQGFEIRSLGADGILGTEDDLRVSWSPSS